MRVALGADDEFVQQDCGFFGGGWDIFAENDPRAHRALAEAGAARHYEKAPPLRGWGFGFCDGGFGLWFLSIRENCLQTHVAHRVVRDFRLGT